jgi:hypothetical protein
VGVSAAPKPAALAIFKNRRREDEWSFDPLMGLSPISQGGFDVAFDAVSIFSVLIKFEMHKLVFAKSQY